MARCLQGVIAVPLRLCPLSIHKPTSRALPYWEATWQCCTHVHLAHLPSCRMRPSCTRGASIVPIANSREPSTGRSSAHTRRRRPCWRPPGCLRHLWNPRAAAVIRRRARAVDASVLCVDVSTSHTGRLRIRSIRSIAALPPWPQPHLCLLHQLLQALQVPILPLLPRGYLLHLPGERLHHRAKRLQKWWDIVRLDLCTC
mmetsp:Transcript_115968/g.289641  ORF Transcript_115968/g.289641 Transcript_115968/m.289641 type:complete len:200 (+) Transcript_115968:94-693(+)